MAALERERSCSDVFARAIECGESVARPLQRGKKTREINRGLDRLRKNFRGTVETRWFVCLVYLVCLVNLVYLVHLVSFAQLRTRQTTQKTQ